MDEEAGRALESIKPRIEDAEALGIIAAFNRADVEFHEIIVQLQAIKLKEMGL